MPTRPRALLLAAALLAGLACTARAADEKKGNSLSIVPSDAAFYSSSLRLKEQMDAFYKSKAYKAIRALPTVKKLHDQAMEKLKEKGGPLEQYEKFTKAKENKELMDVLSESVSDEVFFVGDKGWAPFVTTFYHFYNSVFNGLPAEFAGGASPPQAWARALLGGLAKHKDGLKFPETVMGFRLKTPKKALEQLARLEKLLPVVELFVPQMKDRIETKDEKEKGRLVVVKLDGSMIPWEQIDLTDFEKNKGEFDGLIAHLKKVKFTFALGVRGSDLLLSFGETSGLAERLGKGKSLADLPELKPVVDASAKKLVSIGYTSKAMLEAFYGTNFDYTESIKALKDALKAADLKEERKKAILDDIDELYADMKAALPKPGAMVGHAFLTDAGLESYLHDYGKHDAWKKVKFNLGKHLGGSPVFAAAFGFQATGTWFKMFAKWAGKYRGHVEGFVLDMVDAEMADQYKKAMKTIEPLLKRLMDTTDKVLVPALKEGGLGIVIDAKWKSKRWFNAMPESGKEMPLAELGLLVGTSDGKKFAQAMKEYRLTLNELYAAFREANPNKENLPEVKLPAPESEKAGDADLYWWDIPEGPFDKQIRPTVGTTKSAAVLALSKAHAERLLKPTEWKPRDPALAIKGEVLGCCVLDFPGLIDLVSPWIDHGVMAVVASRHDDDEDGGKKAKAEAGKALKEIKQALEIAKCFKGSTGTTVLAGDVLVHKTVVVVRDYAGAAEEP
ncbi:MAG: hypothetical protein K2W96_09515 [Gemmataceae bacterium]|nr:hypothetical protein [Gemmataceae bacterium]